MLTYLLAFVAAFVAGIVNVLAGSGSLITLPALVFLGLPSPVANGTNRVGIVVQCIVGVETYRRGGKLHGKRAVWYAVPTLVGAVVGAWLATLLSVEQMDFAIGVVMVGMLGVLLIDPAEWLRAESELEEGPPAAWLLAVFFAVGIYGGFIQAGVGIMMLAALVLGAGFEVVEANAVKMVIALVFTAAALAVFAIDGKVNWKFGALMAAGQGLGAWVGASFAVASDEAALWIRRILIVIVVVSAAKFFGVF